jgi:hypothetical protein
MGNTVGGSFPKIMLHPRSLTDKPTHGLAMLSDSCPQLLWS